MSLSNKGNKIHGGWSTRYKYTDLPKHVYRFMIKVFSKKKKKNVWETYYRVAFKHEDKTVTVSYSKDLEEAKQIAKVFSNNL